MPVQNAKASKAIAEAAKINRAMKEGKERLDELKAIIREEAEKVATKRGDDEKVEFESPEGVATVCFVKDSVSIMKGANPRVLKEVLPEVVWSHLFNEVVVLSKEFGEAFDQLPKSQQNTVKKMVEWSENEPRVTLPK